MISDNATALSFGAMLASVLHVMHTEVFNFVLVLCEFHIMHPIPIISTFLHINPQPLQLPPKRKKETNKQKPKHLIGEAVVCHRVYTFVHTSCKCSLQGVIGLV